ncbi:thermonuclease family protein [Aureimonas leprariae]|uniref:Thermonuclease family protein n=1 Tax=Plantimonas leprariae TaxID=2615207 RepID=A0A7V7PNW1_9HYPH|nr:thermonuclease family protein [Aureimonas leprariae]KAB0679368.1 thermonuclease family protein [Aureimonas leprariae]
MVRRTVVALLGCILAVTGSAGSVAAAGEEPGRTVAGPVAASVTKVRDGDTVEVEAYIWPGQVVRTAVRLRGIDAPELKGRCDGERAAAEVARDRLTALVASRIVQLGEISGDKYFGRVLARVASDDVPDVGAKLLAEGLVAPYRGEKRRDWCANDPKLSGFRPAD